MCYIISIYTFKYKYIQYNIHSISSDKGAIDTIKGKRSIAGALNTIPRIKHLKSKLFKLLS